MNETGGALPVEAREENIESAQSAQASALAVAGREAIAGHIVQQEPEGKAIEEKRGTGRRRTRKQIALRALLGFLIAMLLLTIVSRAADALTLPVVTTTSLSQGALRHVIDAQGILEAMKERPLTGETGLIVGELCVATGQVVQEGDVLLRYDADQLQQKIDELERGIKRKELQRALNAADAAGSNAGGGAVDGVKRAQEDIERTEQESLTTIGRAQQDLERAQFDLEKALTDLAYAMQATAQDVNAQAQSQIQAAESAYRDVEAAVSSDRLDKQRALEDAQSALAVFERARWKASQNDEEETEETDSATDDATYAALETAYRRAQEDIQRANADGERRLADARMQLEEARRGAQAQQSTPMDRQAAVAAAQANVDAAQGTVDAKQRALQDALDSAETGRENAQRALENAEQSEKELAKARAQERERAAQERKTAEIQKQIGDLDIEADRVALEALLAIQADPVLRAACAGTVSDVTVRAGEAASGTLLRLAEAEHGYQLRATVDAAQSKHIERGAKVSYLLAGASKYAQEGTVLGLLATAEGCDVRVQLPPGAGTLGQSAEFQIVKQSDAYTQCVPIAALRSFNGQDGVFVVRAVQGVLGEEERLAFVPVRVLDSDRTTAAIEGALTRADRIVVSGTKPIAEGERVRSGQ